MAAVRAEQFSVRVDDEVLDDLRARIRNTRWPGPAPGALWEHGTDLGYLRGLLGYWADGFDWRAQERWLNGFRHFRAGIDGVRVHFVHERARGGRGIPLILTNGWPSCFAEFLPLVPWLTDPAAYGIDGPGFDVVIPSLPGYGFSDRPARTGVTCRYTAGLWHRLMRGLGYQRYGAHGGDFGAAVATLIAGDHARTSWLGIGLSIASLIVMPVLGIAKRRLGARLDSAATAGEGTQNLLCAYLAAAGLAGLLANTLLGWWWLDPVVALGIAGLAVREGIEAWHGEECGC